MAKLRVIGPTQQMAPKPQPQPVPAPQEPKREPLSLDKKKGR